MTSARCAASCFYITNAVQILFSPHKQWSLASQIIQVASRTKQERYFIHHEWVQSLIMPNCQVAIVTGGNNGLGKESVRQLALHGAKVYMASRTESRAIECIDELERDHPELHGKSRIIFLKLDLTSLESCQRAAKEFLEKEERLDILSMCSRQCSN